MVKMTSSCWKTRVMKTIERIRTDNSRRLLLRRWAAVGNHSDILSLLVQPRGLRGRHTDTDAGH